ncbi:PAS domain S-box protein [Prolixibacteraceae bacterium JC049]|nr:PAS domain S-box protein [Prolixibacteraceae bacterium JC049]
MKGKHIEDASGADYLVANLIGKLYQMKDNVAGQIFDFATENISRIINCSFVVVFTEANKEISEGRFFLSEPFLFSDFKKGNNQLLNWFTGQINPEVSNRIENTTSPVNFRFSELEQEINIQNYLLTSTEDTNQNRIHLIAVNKKNGFTTNDLLIGELIVDALKNLFELRRSYVSQKELLSTVQKHEENEKRLRNYFQLGLLGMAITSLDKGWIEVNDTICDFLGYSRDELMSKTWAELTHHDDIDLDVSLFESVLKGEREGYKIDKRFICKNGEIIYSELSVNCVRDDAGKVKYFLALINDITERKKAEWALKEAILRAEESDRLKTEFLNNMSHEVRTPMNGIIGFSSLLDDPGVSEAKRKYYTQIIQNSSHKLLQVIDDILEISTLETKQLRLNESSFCLNDLLMELFSIFDLDSKKRNIPIYLKKQLKDKDSYIVSDKEKIYKVLHNLLTNALKFTNQGYVELGYVVSKENLKLYVKDTGIGISEESKDRIFKRFSQESSEMSQKYGGLGLGLSISKENAELLGGDVTFISEKGTGSTFYLTIPYKADTERVSPKEVEDIIHDNTTDKLTILIAEDEEVNFLFLEALMEDYRHDQIRLIHARNGKEALEHCKENNKIDLVLMDIKMPIMNGHEATKEIKNIHPDLPVVAQSAYSASTDKKLAHEYGCDDFIVKPVDKNELYTILKKYTLNSSES